MRYFSAFAVLCLMVLAWSGASSSAPTPAPATATPSAAPSSLRDAASEFTTDFSRHSVPYEEIFSGGPPKDGIPAIDAPKFVSVSEASAWLRPVEPVVAVVVGRAARAYPIQILVWHEIVNDTVGDVPVVVTYCPLCNTGIAFRRTLDGQTLDFGTTGRLRYSNLVMYDRQTETWWQQATGDAIVGELTGRHLESIPAQMISWQDFATAYPDGQVLSRDTGHQREYGNNPYTGYDNVNSSPFLFSGPPAPGTLPAMARVVTVDLNGEAVAYPYPVLSQEHVVNDTVGGDPLVVSWNPGTASALDARSIAEGADVGSATTFSRRLEGQTLTFAYMDGRVVDEQTGSEGGSTGAAASGPLAGSQLTPVVGINHFWFSWAAFKPETRIYAGRDPAPAP